MFDKLLLLLFPMRCALCSASGNALCNKCFQTISLSDPLPDGQFAAYDYGHPLVQKAIWQLKYHRRSELAATLIKRALPYIAEYCIEQFPNLSKNDHIILVPIPQTKGRYQDRGFSQSAHIANVWRSVLPHALVRKLLSKTRESLPQARVKTKSARARNVMNSMSTYEPLESKSIYIVIDDVITTSATIQEAKRALRDAGARNIIALALAHGYAHK